MITRAVVLFCFVINWIAGDDLPHMAISSVPAILGQTVQLKCSKITERSGYDYTMGSVCDPAEDFCYHAWSKGGELIDLTNPKYSTNSILAYDYCENFEGTSDIVNGINPFVEYYEEERYRVREMVCYTSTLIIRDVEMSDFDEYSCNFSDHLHSSSKYDMYVRKSSVQYITLYNENNNTVLIPKKVDYLQSAYLQQRKDSILAQCVVSGTSLNWEINVVTKDYCYNYDQLSYGIECVLYLGPLEKSRMDHFWRCFNFTTVQHSPFKGVTESFAYFSNVCSMDNARLYCNNRGRDTTSYHDSSKPNQPFVSIEKRSGDSWDEYYKFDYYGDHWLRVTTATVLIIVALLVLASAIVAIVRAKCCNCRRRSTPSAPVIYQYSIQTPFYGRT